MRATPAPAWTPMTTSRITACRMTGRDPGNASRRADQASAITAKGSASGESLPRGMKGVGWAESLHLVCISACIVTESGGAAPSAIPPHRAWSARHAAYPACEGLSCGAAAPIPGIGVCSGSLIDHDHFTRYVRGLLQGVHHIVDTCPHLSGCVYAGYLHNRLPRHSA